MAEETTVSIEEFTALKEEFEQFKEQASKPQMVWVSGTYLGKNEDCYGPINAPHMMNTNEYPFVLTGPDPDMKHPKYDYAANKWIDRGEAYYEAQVKELSNDLKGYTQTVSNLQQSQNVAINQSAQLAKMLESSKQSQEATQKALQQLTVMVSKIVQTAPSSNPTFESTSNEEKQQ
ncbi:hypothetical protein C5L33_001385 [Lactobacillus pasteurii]|uniref:hypothetical protein n=4 Tax=Lactobacillus pasteurii TaxID=872327 RepID=UPI001058EC95|nr:hypothetical protein [Lactobacillus pasteurii]TDG76626.1 hypothetical protein C5L33_001385 [Lactobacillus pasteurii]